MASWHLYQARNQKGQAVTASRQPLGNIINAKPAAPLLKKPALLPPNRPPPVPLGKPAPPLPNRPPPTLPGKPAPLPPNRPHPSKLPGPPNRPAPQPPLPQSKSVSLSPPPEDPQHCSTYVSHIFEYLHKMEALLHPTPGYMVRQDSINLKMRSILIDWLVQVHTKFALQPETLFLTISIIDRFLSTRCILKAEFQLVGVTAMSIACKYEEIYFPNLSDFVTMTDHAYKEEEMRAMEVHILKELDYSLGSPLVIHFLRRFSRIAEVTSRVHTLARFLSELCAVDYQMLEFLPSQQAAAALTLAVKLQADSSKRKQWLQKLQLHVDYRYSEKSLRPCLTRLAQLVTAAPLARQQAVVEKYSAKNFSHVSKDPCLSSKLVRELAAAEKSAQH